MFGCLKFIASAPTLFPPEYIQEFQYCFDQAPAVLFQEIQAILREELGRPIDTVFEYVDPKPIASASVAQVHGARIRGTQEYVVIKVLKLGIEDILVADLNFVYIVAHILEFLSPELSRASLVAIVRDIRESMLEEVDFIKEAANVEAFRTYLEAMGLTRQATAPKVYQQYSSKRVLTMGRLYGVPLTDLNFINSLVPSPEASLVACLPVKAFTQMYMRVICGYYLMAALGFLTLELLGAFSKNTECYGGILGSLATEEYESMASSLIDMGATNKDVDVQAFARDLEKIFLSIQDLDTEIIVATARETNTNATAVYANVVVDERQMNALFLDVVPATRAHLSIYNPPGQGASDTGGRVSHSGLSPQQKLIKG
ncbi:putative aarF domain-containing protein kinase [Forsythia ovata]|uniref:AarF domain-containing protein kinase n=1 Tax=Forsythia ovata TaxID=205694 RepID=A0ABD1X8K9_9LAMI